MKRAYVYAVTMSAMLTACASTTPTSQPYPNQYPYPTSSYPPAPSSQYSRYGVVENVEVIESHSNTPGIGAIAGAVVGGIAGSQFGSGRGATAATIAGAAGGGYIGHKIEQQHAGTKTEYRVTVRLDDGSFQTLKLDHNSAGLRNGDRVVVAADGTLSRY